MRKTLATISTFLSLLFRAAGADTTDLERTRVEFEKLAMELPYLSLVSVLYDRPDHRFQAKDSAERQEHDRIIAKVTDRSLSKKSLLSLTHDASSKVRTLAAAALFDREDPFTLPALVELCDDEARTFDGMQDSRSARVSPYEVRRIRITNTVADVARPMIDLYLRAGGFKWGAKDTTRSEFQNYWAARSNRTHCASWFYVEYDRAIHGTHPPQADSYDRVRAVRGRIDELPPDDRAWVLLWLSGDIASGDWGSPLVSEKELVEACKLLGPVKLMLMLQDKIPSDDPDLQSRRSYNDRYRQMVRFVLAHAKDLLREEDSAALLDRASWHREQSRKNFHEAMLTPLWAIGAATLNPRQASNILHAAWLNFQHEYQLWDRAMLAVAVWTIVGEPELQFLGDWFYTETRSRSSHPNHQESFIRSMEKEPAGRTILAHLIRDPRLNSLDWGNLRSLVAAINRWTQDPVIADDELRKSAQQFGDGSWDGSPNPRVQNNPAELARLRTTMDEWQKRLRESVPLWSQGK